MTRQRIEARHRGEPLQNINSRTIDIYCVGNVVYILNTDALRRRGLVQKPKTVPLSLCVLFSYQLILIRCIIVYLYISPFRENYHPSRSFNVGSILLAELCYVGFSIRLLRIFGFTIREDVVRFLFRISNADIQCIGIANPDEPSASHDCIPWINSLHGICTSS